MDVNQEYGRRPGKPHTMRIVCGALVLMGKLSQVTHPPTNGDVLGRLGLVPLVNVTAFLVDVGSILVWFIGVWLILSGLPGKVRSRSNM